MVCPDDLFFVLSVIEERGVMMGETNQERKIAEVLAELIANRRFEDLPKETIEKAKSCIIDVVGCIVGAAKEPQAQALLEVMKAEGGHSDSSVFVSGFKTSAMNAALINGTFGHIYDFDDAHREATLHPTVVVFPAVFALGEKLGVSGKDLVRSFILGSEVLIRVSEAFLAKSYYQGFHPTGTCGVFGAAAGCASLLGLNVRQTTYALGIAGSFSAGLLEWKTEGTWQKPLQAGHPNMSGVLAASLAGKGFSGARTIFEGPDGFIRAFSFENTYDYARITDNLGKKWEMLDTSVKVHSCCRFCAPVVDCALELYRRGIRAKDVKSILAKVNNFTIKATCEPHEKKIRPMSHVDAQFSTPYGVAVAICRGRMGLDELKEESLFDPEILGLAEKVTCELDPKADAAYPKSYPTTLVAALRDGQKVESHVDYPKGDPENPASMEEIVSKFNLLTEKCFNRKKREKVVETLRRLEEIDNIVEVANLLQ